MHSHRTLLCCLVLCLLLASCHSRKQASGVPGHGTVEYDGGKRQDKPDKPHEESMADKLEKEARLWLGTPYCYGGESLSGTDCSGMVMKIFEKITSVKLPRNSQKQQEFCEPVSLRCVERGDLLFFSTSAKRAGRVNHVGLYIGKGDFIHASTSRGVIISNIEQDYYRWHFHSAGRVPGIRQPKNQPAALPDHTEKDPEAPSEEVSGPDNMTFSSDSISPQAEGDSIRNEVRRAMMQ